ncbi:MAG: hypothetical protein EBZ74_05650 [Planctomycetia bacterium]|nr:hypothetical protein [Planctomycetia bacterium]
MPGFIVDIAVLITVGYLGWLGSDRGIFAMAAAGLLALASLTLAILLLEPTAAIVAGGLETAVAAFLPTDFPFEAWGMFLAFVILFWIPFLVLWVAVYPLLPTGGDMKSQAIIEKIGGALIGGLDGVLLLGAGLLTLSMLPFFNGLKVNADALLFDVGRSTLRAACGFAGDWHEGRSLVLDGEPITGRAGDGVRLSCEPWCDLNDDASFSETDRYRDADGNGKFSADLFYRDLDGSSARRIGLVDKYVVGRWDAYLQMNNRDLPEPQPAAAAARPTAPPAAAKSPAPAPAKKPAEPPRPRPDDAADEEEVEVVLVDEDGNVVSAEDAAGGDVEVVEEVVEEVMEEGGAAAEKP